MTVTPTHGQYAGRTLIFGDGHRQCQASDGDDLCRVVLHGSNDPLGCPRVVTDGRLRTVSSQRVYPSPESNHG